MEEHSSLHDPAVSDRKVYFRGMYQNAFYGCN